MSRVARSPQIVALTVAALLLGSIAYSACARTNASLAAAPPSLSMQQNPPAPPLHSGSEVEDALLRAGFDAKALTAVGVSTQQLPAFVVAFRDAYATQRAAIDAADTAVDAARVASDAMLRTIQSGKGTPADVTTYQAQLAAMAAAKTSRQTAIAAACAPAEALLSTNQRAQLARIRTNKTWELPMEFLLVDRTETEWVALRDALANEKIAPRYHETTAPQHAAVLGAARSANDVALAKTRLDTNLAAMASGLHTAIVE